MDQQADKETKFPACPTCKKVLRFIIITKEKIAATIVKRDKDPTSQAPTFMVKMELSDAAEPELELEVRCPSCPSMRFYQLERLAKIITGVEKDLVVLPCFDPEAPGQTRYIPNPNYQYNIMGDSNDELDYMGSHSGWASESVPKPELILLRRPREE